MTASPLVKAKSTANKLFANDHVQGYIFIMPVVLGLIFFVFGPMIASFYFSLTEYSILQSPEFIGTRNYVDIFTRPQLRVLHSLWITVVYALISVPLTLVAALGAAILINQDNAVDLLAASDMLLLEDLKLLIQIEVELTKFSITQE